MGDVIPWSKIIIGVAIVGALIWLYAEIRDQGAESLRNSIERQNNDAARKADDAALDYDGCRDAGRVWDFRAGRCIGTAQSRRR